MHDRCEPRFRTEAPASVTVVRHDNFCEFRCSIVDISGVGFRLKMCDSLQPGETIRLEVSQDHLIIHVIAVVRYCNAKDDEFSVGVERVDDWLLKRALTEPEADASSAVSKLAAIPVETPGGEPVPVIGRPKVKHLNILTKVSTHQLFITMSERTKRRSRMKQVRKKAAGVASAVFAIAALGLFFGRAPIKVRAGSASPDASATRSAVAASHTDVNQIQPVATQSATAPQSSVSLQQPAAQVKPVEQRTVAPAVIARQIATSPSPAQPVHQGAQPAHTGIVPEKQHKILFKSTGANWVVACADGKKVFEKLLKAGDTDEIAFSTQALLNAGNAAASEVTLDSRSLGAMGKLGSIHAWRFSGEAYEDVPPAHNQTCELR